MILLITCMYNTCIIWYDVIIEIVDKPSSLWSSSSKVSSSTSLKKDGYEGLTAEQL